MRQLRRCIVSKLIILRRARIMQHLMNGKIKRLLILEIILKGWSTKVKIVKVSGQRLGRKEAMKDG